MIFRVTCAVSSLTCLCVLSVVVLKVSLFIHLQISGELLNCAGKV